MGTRSIPSARAGRVAIAVATAIAAFGLAYVALGIGAAPDAVAQQAQSQPNIVLLESDDQTQEEMRFLPATQRLIGDRGATFPTNFAVWPLCCPSRATLYTGQYPHNHGVLGNKGAPFGGFGRFHNETALPVWLSNAGYYTAHIGKFLNGYEESPIGVPPGWSEWHGSKDTYRYYGYDLFEDNNWVQYGDENEDPDNPAHPETYSTDVYTNKATQIIRERAPSDQPFFLSVGFLAPHGGEPNHRPDGSDASCTRTAKPAVQDLGVFDSLPVPRPPSFNEANVTDKPATIRDLPLLGPVAQARVDERYRCRAESLLDLDRGVKAIMKELKASGELDNTLVIFTSDNGFFHGEHRIPSGKNRVYEEAVRVPLLMRGPGIPRGVTVNDMSANIDLAPTMADVSGATPLVTPDGRSLMPLAQNPDRYTGREILLEQYSGLGEAGEPNTGVYTAVRTPRYKFVANSSGENELYDLEKDPYELNNLDGKERFGELEADLRQQLARLSKCVGEECERQPFAKLAVTGLAGKHPQSCAKRIQISVTGRESAPVTGTRFFVNGLPVGGTDREPFAVTVPSKKLGNARRVDVTANTTFLDGRIRTLSSRYALCN